MTAKELKYEYLTYDLLSVDHLNKISIFVGIVLTNKQSYPYFVSRLTTGRTLNTPNAINTNLKIEDAFGNILLVGPAEDVYQKLYILTENDVPF